ncbi:unnamed protein product, partial [Meganyctiphanes norvegica]
MHLSLVVVFVLGISGVLSRAQISPGFNANCICTPYYKCYDGETSSPVQGTVDDRDNFQITDSRTIITVRQENEPATCPEVLDRCCHNLAPNQNSPTFPPPQPSRIPITPSPQPFPASPSQPQTTTSNPSSQPRPGTSHLGASNGACGIRNSDGVDFEIQGFKEGQAQYGEFPWMVALLARNTGFGADEGGDNLFLGGGSLIHPQVVLTAAHKAYDNSNTKLTVRVGEWNFRTTNEPHPHQNIPVKEVIIHPRFKRDTMVFNIALLILEQPAVLGITVPSCKTVNCRRQHCIYNFTLYQWGRELVKKERSSHILKPIIIKSGYSNAQWNMGRMSHGPLLGMEEAYSFNGLSACEGCPAEEGAPLIYPPEIKISGYIWHERTHSFNIGVGLGVVAVAVVEVVHLSEGSKNILRY